MKHSSNLIVVGIGASAGGLEALQEFFKNMPIKTGLAFVVIQHLSPDYRSLMDELLARETSIPIRVAADGMEIEADHIYLIPPRKNISIFHDKLYLEEQESKKRLNLPVDIFFRSLAQEKGKVAIGIILSGTGSDGTLGTRAIKEAGGMIMVQDEKSAKFDGMPRSSVSTGLVDYILPPDRMPDELVSFVKHPFVKQKKTLDGVLLENLDTLTKIILLLRDHGGIDFSFYKDNTLVRRLERRVSINRYETLEEYLDFLKDSEKEKETLQRELLIGVTRFFRDAEAFDALRTKVLPSFVGKKTIRVWSAGCSTGEEAYSLAIMLNEFQEAHSLTADIKIFATDIDRSSIEYAGRGFYPESVVADLDPMLLTKYFIRKENGYQICESIRKMIVFAGHNLLKDSPFSRIDLLVCRNLFIYLKPEIQAKVLGMFYYSLSSDGVLFMGNSETIGDMSAAFECIDNKWKIFRFKEGYKPQPGKMLPIIKSPYADGDRGPFPSKISLEEGMKMERLLDFALSSYLDPSVILDGSDNIIHIVNDVSPFVKMQPGRFSQNIFDNLSPDLSLFVSTLLRKLKREGTAGAFENLIELRDFADKRLTVEGRRIGNERNTYYVLSFHLGEAAVQDAEERIEAEPRRNQAMERVSDLEKELQFTKESLQATVEELETSNEELQSSNEELIASNEELQSTNEELQSVNEELYTVNTEYQTKIEELTRLNNDVNNLLKNTEVGALYLDRNLCIRKITPIVSRLTNILQSDLGRPVYHISLGPGTEGLLQDIQSVVDTLQPVDKELYLEGSGTFLVRIRPYRTDYNAVDGVLVVFVDISELKAQYRRAELTAGRLENALKIGRMAWWEWDVKSGEVRFDDRKATMLGYAPEEFPREVHQVCSLIHGEDYEDTMQAMRDYLEGRSSSWDLVYRMRRKDGSYAWYYDKGEITERSPEGAPLRLVGTVIDVSRLQNLEKELGHRAMMLERILENSPLAKTMVDAEGCLTYANEKAAALLGIPKEEVLRRTFDCPEWRIRGEDGRELAAEELPFAIIKRTRLPVTGFRHYIEVEGAENRLLSIHGTPLFSLEGEFEGAVFALEVVDGA